MTAELLIDGSDGEYFDVDMDEANFQAVVNTLANVDNKWIRDKAYRNKSLFNFLNSPRFLLEFARHTGASQKLPPPAWLKFQMANEFFRVENETHAFNLKEIVLDKTRHGFAQVDVAFESVYGVKPVQDLGGCEADCLLRNVFILENLNHPVVRMDPSIFTQTWILAYIRPKFVFRGLIACPKGDYGLAQMIVEIGDSSSRRVRSNVRVPFKKDDESATGKFVPFEVVSPDYDFRPSTVFLFVMTFYVNSAGHLNPGFRIANCTLQCQLPDEIVPLSKVGRSESVPSDHLDKPLHTAVYYTVIPEDEPQYLRRLREQFYSVIENARILRDEESARALEEMETMMGGDLLSEQPKMQIEDITDFREDPKKRRDLFDDEEPCAKKRC